MFEGLLTAAARHARWASFLVVGVVVGFAFWEPLFAGATLAPLDLIESVSHPQRAYRELGAHTDRASGDLVNIHAHWVSFGRIVRGFDGWWDPSVAQGYPIMKGGFPLFALAYVVFPGWFAAGAMTVARTVTAWSLTSGWLRRFELRRSSALVGGAAYAFSGYLVGWGGWPHANVAAFAPGLLWALEGLLEDRSARRGVPVGMTIAAMVWSNSPLASAYILLGVVLYVSVRLIGEHGRACFGVVLVRLPALGVGVITAVGLAFPHLRYFSEWLEWVETSHRQFSTDNAAGIDFLLTAAFPAAFGTDGHGPAFFANGNWIEFQMFVGASVLLVAAFAAAAARGTDALAVRRRSAVRALWGVTVLGVLVAYVGGPVTDVIQTVMGDVSGLATRAKVLISIGFAGLAGFGFDAWIDPSEQARVARQRLIRWVGAGVVLVGLAFVPAGLRWLDLVAEVGERRGVAVMLLPHLLAVGLVAVVMVGAQRRRLSSSGVVVVLAVTIVAELLWFARPIPTVFDAGEVFEPLAEHELVIDELGPGERFGGSYQTLWPAATQAFDIPTIGGQTLKSPGFQALLRAVDPIVFEPEAFGSPGYPSIPPSVSPALSVWDALGVGVWGSAPSHAPVGTRLDPEPGFAMDDVARGPIEGTLVIPEGGLRAVVVDALISPIPGRIELDVEVGDRTISTWMPHDEVWPGERHALAIPIVGDDLVAGETAHITLRSTGEPGSFLAGVSLQGELMVGSIAGRDDGLRMLSTGAVTLLERTDVAPFRLHDAAVVVPDLETAARLVVDRPQIAGAPVVVDSAVDLPASPSPDAVLEIGARSVGRDHVTAAVTVDRAALLVLPVPVYPGWTATLDGEPVELITADTTFAAVLVPPGTHDVTLRFAPDGLGLTVAVFVLTALFGLGLWFAPTGSRRRGGGSRAKNAASTVEVP